MMKQNPIPYGFDSIQQDKAILDTPLWRDGTSLEPRLSGEILITLQARTPLLVGNQQHKLDQAQNVLVPQMLDDGRVLLSGASLKGMLRSALSGLLHAPMERVAEHHYTYRPNLGFGSKYEVRAAVIEHVEPPPEDQQGQPPYKVSITLLPHKYPVVFVRADAGRKFSNYTAGQLIRGKCSNLKLSLQGRKNRLMPEQDQNATLHHYLLHYIGGIDGKGFLTQAFKSNNRVYSNVLVDAQVLDDARQHPSCRIDIPNDLLLAYWRTQEILADRQHGHLHSAHPLVGKLSDPDKASEAIRKNRGLRKNQLIYVEYDPKQNHIVSFGHHFHYRWAYRSSVRSKNRLLDPHSPLRPELHFHPQEKADEQSGAPQALTAARLLFGYAQSNKDEGVAFARGSYRRLAGRVAFNTAIEVSDDKTASQRFIDGGGPVTLKVLGLPRPSAVEFYLKQPGKMDKLTTYGDLPDEEGGDLSGRKYYRHQPDVRQHEKKTHYATDRGIERGTTVRYLSAPGSEFRTTLRFDSLRPWELGAVLLALDPDMTSPHLGIAPHPDGHAHKLGYGKPLGLGSVQLRLDGARWRENDIGPWHQVNHVDERTELVQHCLAALTEKLHATWGENWRQPVEQWLEPRRWHRSGLAEYPRSKKTRTIFGFHTDLRRQHAAARRGKSENFHDLEAHLKARP